MFNIILGPDVPKGRVMVCIPHALDMFSHA